MMTTMRSVAPVLVVGSLAALASAQASSQQQTPVQIPQPGVPQDEEKKLGKNYGNIKTQVDNTFKKATKKK